MNNSSIAKPFIDDGYSFEELDDPRTSDGSLVPDFSKELTAKDYYKLLLDVIDACGKVGYFFKMYKNVMRDANRAKAFAEEKGYNAEYYRKHTEAWKFEARRAFGLYQLAASQFGLKVLMDDDEKRHFFNNLLEADRRDSFRQSIKTASLHNEILSLETLEEKYQNRIKRRAKKKAF